MTAVRFLGPDTGRVRRQRRAPRRRVQEQTGIELDVQIIPSDLYYSNRIHHLLDGEGAPTSTCQARCSCGSTSPPASWSRSTTSPASSTARTLATSSSPARREPLERPLRRPARRRGRCWRSRSTASRTTSRTCRAPRARGLGVPAHVGRVLLDRREHVATGRGLRLRPARHRRVAHDVHGLRDPAVVIRRHRLRGRPLRDRRPRRGAGDGVLVALHDAGPPLARPALVRAGARLRRRPVRADRRLRPLRRVLRGSATLRLAGKIAYALPPAGPPGAPPQPLDVVGGDEHARAPTSRPPGASSSGRPARSSCSARRSRAT